MHVAERVADLSAALEAEAVRANERRLLALEGDRDASITLIDQVLDRTEISREQTTLVSDRQGLACERVPPKRAGTLLGTTRQAVVLDWHDTCQPNALGQVVGVVDGGGLFVVLLPSDGEWSADGCAFHESLAVPPTQVREVTVHYHDRVRELLRSHPGVAVVDVETGTLHSEGLTDPPPVEESSRPSPPHDADFPEEAYAACLTRDQARAVATLECLIEPQGTAIVQADRGRGKSSAAGLAAGALAARGVSVVVTAPGRQGTRPLFERSRALLRDIDALSEDSRWQVETDSGGSVSFREVGAAVEAADSTDVVLVDEAAGLPVRRLQALLAADRVAFITTVHGYEGAGRGFDVRFREHLMNSDRTVHESEMREPIRYAAGDPIEAWANRTLLLDARGPVTSLVRSADPDSVRLRQFDSEALREDEHRLRSIFGLLIEAHYRTEPDDLVRLLDAPNVRVHALLQDGWVVTVALLAKEGGLGETRREAIYEGQRIRGNLLPDLFASQLRDADAAAATGLRILRIATHHAVRSRGLGSRLLADISAELSRSDAVDWLGVGYGATPELLEFWTENGYGTVHLSTTRNDTSGEYSALMLRPLTPAGETLHDRLAGRLVRRIPAVLGDALADMDPDIVRAALRSIRTDVEVALTDHEWRVVSGAAFGPGLYDVDPRPFRRLALAHFVNRQTEPLPQRHELLLVTKVLQGRPWAAVVDTLDYASVSECKRELGAVYTELAERYGGDVVATERERYEE